MKVFLKAVKKFTNAESVFLGVIFLILALLVFAQILLRTFKIGNLTWLDELCRVVMVDTSFIGACVALSQDHLICLTLITDKLGNAAKNILGIITNLIGAAFACWLATCGWRSMMDMIATDVRTVSLGIPYWLTYLPIAVSLFGMAVRFVLLAFCNLKRIQAPAWDYDTAAEG